MRLRYAVAVIVLASAPLAAHADTFLFNYTPLPDYSTPDDPVRFTLDSSRSPDIFGSVFDGNAFYYTNVPVISNGITYIREVGFGQFLGDFTGYNTYLYELGVGQSVIMNVGDIYIGATSPRAGFFNDTAFFTGTPSAPVFLSGVYSFPTDGILTITDQTTSVTPEPSTFALLGTGILGIAGLLRRRTA